MTEPNYEYVKGQGWVITVPKEVTMRCGTRVRLENRKPKTGERASYNFTRNAEFNWARWAEGTHFRAINVRQEIEFDDFDWCVLVPL